MIPVPMGEPTKTDGILAIVCVLLVVIGISVWLVNDSQKEVVVERLENVVPGCKDYITIPMHRCKKGSELKLTHCRCSKHWVVTNDVTVEWVKNTSPSGYRIVKQ